MMKPVHTMLPVKSFEKALDIFMSNNENNEMLMKQLRAKRLKREKIKFLRFMGYLQNNEN